MAKARFRRRQDGHIVGPLTPKQASNLAGHSEGEWQVEELKDGARVWTDIPATAQVPVDGNAGDGDAGEQSDGQGPAE